jgi:ubiquinone/menaquinone biosynthesis C-methylase UbiE
MSSFYDRMMRSVEEASLKAERKQLLEGMKGRILEVGAGTGANLAHYDRSVNLYLSEPDPSMYGTLAAKLNGNLSGVAVLASKAEALPFPSEAFDHIVSTLVLCSVSNQPRALAEVWRVLVPGGRFTFIEHVRSCGRRGRWQDRLQPLWSRFGRGCHPNRTTLTGLEAAGFKIETHRYFDPSETFPFWARLAFQLVIPFVRGTALKPEAIVDHHPSWS